MQFNNIKDAIYWLEHQPRFKEKTDLNIVKNAFDKLNINLEGIKKIHIGGTNGKGSTSQFLTTILTANKIKVGTFTSPYLVKFNERIKINNNYISDDELLNYINFFYEFNNTLNEKLSFFEILTLLSFKYFSDQKCEAIIMEVGIGGRLDATNIINYDVSVITSVGLDHVDKLGSTLLEIANEKIQILKPQGHLISAVADEVKQFFIQYAQKNKATFKFIKLRDIFPFTPNSFYYGSKLIEVGLLGDYQRTNALLAYETAQYLYNFNDIQILPALKETKWPGRFEEISSNCYIDGAHNIPAIEALMRNITYIFRNKKITILFSALKDKQIKEMLEVIKKYNFKIILTSFPDFRFKSLEEFSNENIHYIEDGYQTFINLINNKDEDEVIIATGSLHFIGYLKQMIANYEVKNE